MLVKTGIHFENSKHQRKYAVDEAVEESRPARRRLYATIRSTKKIWKMTEKGR